MWLADFIKSFSSKTSDASKEKWIFQNIKDFWEKIVRERKASNNEETVWEVINTNVIPANLVNRDAINNMQNIWDDGVVSDEEKKYVSELPDIYQNIFNSSKSLSDFQNYVFTDKYLQASPEVSKKMKDEYVYNLDRLQYNLWRLEKIQPWYKKWSDADKKYIEDFQTLYTPKMQDIENIYWTNSEIANSYNVTVFDAANDTIDLRRQAREAWLEQDTVFMKNVDELEKKKKQRQDLIYLKLKNNQQSLKNGSRTDDAFKVISEDETINSLAREITDLDENIRQWLMKASVKNTWNRFLQNPSTAWITRTLYKWAEYLTSFVDRWLDELFQSAASVKANDLSDIQYLTSTASFQDNWMDAASKWFWAATNWAVRSWWEISSLLIPLSWAWKAVKWATSLWKFAKIIDKASDARKIVDSINDSKKVFNLVKGTVWIDTAFDYNLSAWLSDQNTDWNIALNAIWDWLWPLFSKISDIRKANKIMLSAKELENLWKESELVLKTADWWEIKTNIYDFVDWKSAQDVVDAIRNWAITDMKTAEISFKNAIDNYLSKINTWDKIAEDSAKAFVRDVFSKMADASKDPLEARKLKDTVEYWIKSKENLTKLLELSKKWFTDMYNNSVNQVKSYYDFVSGSLKQTWQVPVEPLSKMVDYKEDFVKNLATQFSWKTVPADIRKSIDAITKQINDTWKINDSQVLEIVRNFNKVYDSWAAADYITRFNDFIKSTLKYVPDWLKSVDNLKKIESLSNSKFVDNIKKAWLSVKFSDLGDWIGGTFKNDTAIISTMKDFYKNPDDFVVWFIHELAHGLIVKNSKLYKEISAEYIKQVDSVNAKFSNIYEWFDIKNIDYDKLDEIWFTIEEQEYLRILSYRYKNPAEFIAYNLSEALIWMKPSEQISILKEKIKSVSDVVFEWRDLDAVFRTAADKIINQRYAANKLDPTIGRDIENYTYSADIRNKYVQKYVDIAQWIQDIWSVDRLQDVVARTDIISLATNLKRLDKQAYDVLMAAYEWGDETTQAFIKSSVMNGMINGNKWYDAIVSWWLFDVFWDFKSYELSWVDIDTPAKIKEFMKSWDFQIAKINDKIDIMLRYIPDNSQYKTVRKTLSDLRALTEYYGNVDLLLKIDALPNKSDFLYIIKDLRNKIQELQVWWWTKLKNLYGLRKWEKASSVLRKWINDIVWDLSKTVGTKWVELNDYLLRTLRKEVLTNEKIETVWFWTWYEFVKSLWLKIADKNAVMQDVFQRMWAIDYDKMSKATGSLFWLARLFWIDDTTLLNDARKVAIVNKLVDSDLLKVFSDKEFWWAKYVASKNDVLEFLNLKDFTISSDNIDYIFSAIYNRFDYDIAKQIADRIWYILKQDKNLANYVDDAKIIADVWAKNEKRVVDANMDFIVESFWNKPIKKELWELQNLAKYDIDIWEWWAIARLRMWNMIEYRQSPEWFTAIVDNSQARWVADMIKWTVKSNIVFDIENKALYSTLWLKKWNAKWVAEFMNNMVYSWKLEDSWLESLWADIDDLVNWNKLPTSEDWLKKYIKSYEELYQKCISNFWLDDEVTKYVWAKKSIANMYGSLMKTTDDVQYFRWLDQLSSKTVDYLQKDLNKLESMTSKKDITWANKIIKEISKAFSNWITEDELLKAATKNKKFFDLSWLISSNRYLVPWARQSWSVSWESVKNVTELKDYIRNMKTTMTYMKDEVLSNKAKYLTRQSETENMLYDLKSLANNWIEISAYWLENVSDLNRYLNKVGMTENARNRIWKKSNAAKEFYENNIDWFKSWTHTVPAKMAESIKNSVASVIAWKYWLDSLSIKDWVSVDYVRANVARISYRTPDWQVVSYFVDTKNFDNTSRFYQFLLTKEDVVNWKEVSFKIWWTADEPIESTIIIDDAKYNGIIDQNVYDIIDSTDPSDLETSWRTVWKEILSTEYMREFNWDLSMHRIFDFLMENGAVLRESSSEAYVITQWINLAVTNSAKYINDSFKLIENEEKALKSFWEHYHANREFVKALILWDKIIQSWKAVVDWQPLEATKEWLERFKWRMWTSYKLIDFARENWIQISEVNKIDTAMNYSEKEMKSIGQYAGVKYFLDKKYWENLLTEYKWDSTKLIDDMVSLHAEMFSDVYKKTGTDIDKEVIKEKIEQILLSKKSLNVLWFNKDMQSFGIYERLTTSLRQEYPWVKTIKEAMASWKLDAKQQDRIYKDIMGTSLYGKNLFSKVISRIRLETYWLQLWWHSPKAWVIAWQNLVSNMVEIFSKRWAMTNTSENVRKITSRLIDSPYFSKSASKLFWPNWDFLVRLKLSSASIWKNMEVGWISVAEKVVNKSIDWSYAVVEKIKESVWAQWSTTERLNKVLWKERTREDLMAKFLSPIWVVDEMTAWKFMEDLAYNKVFDEIWISTDTFNSMLDEIDEIDSSLKWKKWMERISLETRKRELVNRVDKLINYSAREALFEYNNLFKAWTMPGLMRNWFSRWTYMTFFSSWGSKKAWEYMYNAMYKPFATAYMAYKLWWIWAAGKSLANELFTNRYWNALFKQSVYAARTLYQLEKDDDFEWIGSENFSQWFMTVSPFWQALKSFFLTRAVWEWIIQYKAAKKEWLSAIESAKYWLSSAMYAITSQFLKEVKFFAWPIAMAINEAWQEWWDDNVLHSIADKMRYSLNTSLYYSMYDMYKWFENKRLDSDTLYPFLDAIMGDVVTKYRWDMDKFMDSVYLDWKIEKWEIKIDWVEQFKNWMSWLPKSYNKRFSLDQMNDVSRNDETYKAIKSWELSSVPDLIKSNIMKYFMEHNWKSEFSMDAKENNKIHWKVALILNELQSNWVDIDWLTKAINDGNIKTAQKEMMILLASWMTKAESTTVLAYMANNAYQDLQESYRKAWYSFKKNPEIQEQIYRNLFDIIMPTAIDVDKQVHADLLFNYVRSAYGWTIPWLKWFEVNEVWWIKWTWWEDNDTIKMFKLWLLAEVADWESVWFRRDLLQNAGMAVLQDVKDESVAKKTIEMFDFVDNLKSVTESGKMVAKASMLYGNLNRMKTLLNSKYAPAMEEEMVKLADIIWNTDDKLQTTPELLDTLSTWWRKKIKAPKSLDLQKDVVKKVNELKNSIPKELKSKALNLSYNRIDAKIKELSLPKLQVTRDEYKEIAMTPISSTPLKTADVRVAEWKPTTSKPKIKLTKPVTRKDEQIRKPKPTKPTRISDRKS